MPCNSCPARSDETLSRPEDKHSGQDPEPQRGPALDAPPNDKGREEEALLRLRIRLRQFFCVRSSLLQGPGKRPTQEQAGARGFYSRRVTFGQNRLIAA